MTTITETQSSPPPLDPAITPTSTLRSSLAQVLNALDGGNRSAGSIASERVSERQLYFALVFAKAKELKPTLGAELLAEVPRLRETLRDRKSGNPLPKAIEAVLRRAVREQRVSPADVKDLKAYALGRAQTDAQRGHLSSRRAHLVNRFDERNQLSPMDAVAKQVETNPTATARELARFEKDLTAGPTIRLKRPSTTAQPDATPAPTGNRSVTTLPTPNPEEFDWRLAENGTSATICLPRQMTGQARFVEVRDGADRVITVAERLTDDEYGRGRWHCRFANDTLPPMSACVVAVGRESDTFSFVVPDSHSPYMDIV